MTIAPGVEITPKAAADVRWLEKALGSRFLGWTETNDALFGPVELVLRRSTKKEVAFYGTLESAASKARAAVEGASR